MSRVRLNNIQLINKTDKNPLMLNNCFITAANMVDLSGKLFFVPINLACRYHHVLVVKAFEVSPNFTQNTKAFYTCTDYWADHNRLLFWLPHAIQSCERYRLKKGEKIILHNTHGHSLSQYRPTIFITARNYLDYINAIPNGFDNTIGRYLTSNDIHALSDQKDKVQDSPAATGVKHPILMHINEQKERGGQVQKNRIPPTHFIRFYVSRPAVLSLTPKQSDTSVVVLDEHNKLRLLKVERMHNILFLHYRSDHHDYYTGPLNVQQSDAPGYCIGKSLMAPIGGYQFLPICTQIRLSVGTGLILSQ